jgi:hypothetical protein
MSVPDLTTGNCVGVQLDVFFPISVDDVKYFKPMAQQICDPCPVFNKCLEYALGVKVDGIWAGTDEEERKAIRKARGITAISITQEYEREYFMSETPEAKAARKKRARNLTRRKN